MAADAPSNDDGELYENAACGLLTTRDNGLIVRVNRTFCQWLGYSATEIEQRLRLQDLLTMGGKIFHQTHWWPLLQLQGSVAEVQLELIHRDGHPLAVLMNGAKRASPNGALHDLAIFVATDRRKYERELLNARKRAEELLSSERAAQEALVAAQTVLHATLEQRAVLAEQLVGIVSHDLRSPMSTVTLGAHLLSSSSELSLVQQRTVARVSSAAARATRLIADLLDFTQARLGGGLRVDCKEVDLHEVVGECVEELKLSWSGRMLEHRRTGLGLGFVDADRVSQVITNLTTNALTYGDPQRPVCVTSSGTSDALGISVHNFGPPIPEALLPHVFEPMRRGAQQVQLGSRSVGLGLYIVHEIARAHGGSVSISSTVEEGTTFRFEVPRGRAGGRR